MDEETRRLMEEYEVEEDVAEQAQELIEEGLDEDEAVEPYDILTNWSLLGCQKSFW